MRIHDAVPEAKRIGYFKDAWMRFKRNKVSVAAAIIIIIIVLFSFITPLINTHSMTFSDTFFRYARPRVQAFDRSGFWDGGFQRNQPDTGLLFYIGIAQQTVWGERPGLGEGRWVYPEDGSDRFWQPVWDFVEPTRDGEGAIWYNSVNSNMSPLIRINESFNAATGIRFVDDEYGNRVIENIYRRLWNARVSSYHRIGFVSMQLMPERVAEIRAWEDCEIQNPDRRQVLFPVIDYGGTRPGQESPFFHHAFWFDPNDHAQIWWRHDRFGNPLDRNGNPMTLEEVMLYGLVDNYLRNAAGVIQFERRVGTPQNPMFEVRVNYYNFFYMTHGMEPFFALGASPDGFDIWARMAAGFRLSIMLATAVSILNLLIGAILGAIAGYYGGKVDLFMERFREILVNIPTIAVFMLVNIHLIATNRIGPFGGVLFVFVAFGWMGMMSLTRTQFYRFKNQEYVMAARTLGAKDPRIMFRHIFPNAIGTIITSMILIIPGTITMEATLNFLGIISLQDRYTASLGTMLAVGPEVFREGPHVFIFPAIMLSLLLIAFNLFGNGLRDAFNPSLRGTGE